jgi:DNA polymerase sigma
MVIQFLQNLPSPILCNIQDICRDQPRPKVQFEHSHSRKSTPTAPGPTAGGQTIEVSFTEDMLSSRSFLDNAFKGENKSSVDDLFRQFLHFYGTEFDWASQVVSIANGKPITKGSALVTDTSRHMVIEDPIERDRNVARSVSYSGTEVIKWSLEGSLRSLEKGTPLAEILKHGPNGLYWRGV